MNSFSSLPTYTGSTSLDMSRYIVGLMISEGILVRCGRLAMRLITAEVSSTSTIMA
jgi:hypothetical protein